MKIEINVSSITIIERDGATDWVVLKTDLPSTFPAEYSKEPLALRSEATKGTGEAYVKKHFPGVPIRVINVDTGEERIS